MTKTESNKQKIKEKNKIKLILAHSLMTGSMAFFAFTLFTYYIHGMAVKEFSYIFRNFIASTITFVTMFLIHVIRESKHKWLK